MKSPFDEDMFALPKHFCRFGPRLPSYSHWPEHVRARG